MRPAPPHPSDERLRQRLERLYGEARGAEAAARLLERLAAFPGVPDARPTPRSDQATSRFDEATTVLITYGDALRADGRAPLAVLRDFARQHLRGAFSAIHLLPFFPYSSDDGFSVIDFLEVDPALGSWQDVRALREAGFELVFDFVLNHISSQSPWFQRYLAGEESFAGLALKIDCTADLDRVVRPRALPLATTFERGDGATVRLWTTFSADQVDLDYSNPAVLLRMVDVMLAYVERGATLLRLDAVAFLWKRAGTSCIHLQETHEVVRLLREILDRVAPGVALLTETNVPHAENLSYFGDGHDEAQLVYNFSLPPLLLSALHRGDGTTLSRWAATLAAPSTETTFFNFTASHDGIGVRPLEGLVEPSVIDELAALARARGGLVSERHGPAGRRLPYELNVTYVDALRGTDAGGDVFHVARLLASQAVALALPGVPAIYLPTLLGHRNWQAGVALAGQARSINREKVALTRLEAELAPDGGFRRRVFEGLCGLLALRRRQAAFAPAVRAEVHELHPGVFALARHAERQSLLALTNLTDTALDVVLPPGFRDAGVHDLLAPADDCPMHRLCPYQTRWLTHRAA